MSSSSSASATTTSPTEIATISKMSSQKKEDPLLQQQQQMRAKSIEKELERKRQRQIEKDNPSTTPKSKVDAALENPAFIQHVLNSPENVDKMLNETETSVYELLYKDPIDYIGEHLVDAYRYKPLLKSNDEHIKLNHGTKLEDLFRGIDEEYPSKWDPTHPKIAKVLSTYEEKFTTEFPDGLSPGIADSPIKCINSIVQFCDSHPEWNQSYPINMAIAANDVVKLKFLINLDVESIHRKMDMDGIATGPGDWAVYLGRLHCFIVLLKAGLNPWKGRAWVDAEQENIIPLLELKADLEGCCSPSVALTAEDNDRAISSSTNYDEKSLIDDAQIEQEKELQEDNNGSTIIKNKKINNNNVFNELISYYNGGGGSDLKQK